jgi:methylated-DNA-protein-cysteine methyltransferase-like protein
MPAKKKIATGNAGLRSVIPTGLKDLDFAEQVYEIVRQIPKGRVTSYGAIAKCIGTGKSARLVGWAMSVCGKVKPKVPAHRVVNSAGVLSGKLAFKTSTYMEELLAKEGVLVKNDKVVDFKKRFWNPSEELSL